MEGPGFAVGTHVPAGSGAGDGACTGVFIDEADEHVAQDVHFRHALGELRVHAGGFGIVAAAEDGFGLRAAAEGSEQEGGEQVSLHMFSFGLFYFSIRRYWLRTCPMMFGS